MYNNVDRYNRSIYSTTLNNYETYEYDNCCDSYNKQTNTLFNSGQINTNDNNYKNTYQNIIQCPPSCNCDCHYRKCCKCNCQNNIEVINQLNNLCRKYSDLQTVHNQLLNDYNQLMNKYNSANSYIQNLERQFQNNNNDNNIKSNNFSYQNPNDINSYSQMMNNSFDKIVKPLSDLCKNPNGKLRGGVNYYLDKPESYNMVLNTIKNLLDNPKIQEVIVQNSNLNNELYPNNELINNEKTFPNDNPYFYMNNYDYLNKNRVPKQREGINDNFNNQISPNNIQDSYQLQNTNQNIPQEFNNNNPNSYQNNLLNPQLNNNNPNLSQNNLPNPQLNNNNPNLYPNNLPNPQLNNNNPNLSQINLPNPQLNNNNQNYYPNNIPSNQNNINPNDIRNNILNPNPLLKNQNPNNYNEINPQLSNIPTNIPKNNNSYLPNQNMNNQIKSPLNNNSSLLTPNSTYEISYSPQISPIKNNLTEPYNTLNTIKKINNYNPFESNILPNDISNYDPNKDPNNPYNQFTYSPNNTNNFGETFGSNGSFNPKDIIKNPFDNKSNNFDNPEILEKIESKIQNNEIPKNLDNETQNDKMNPLNKLRTNKKNIPSNNIKKKVLKQIPKNIRENSPTLKANRDNILHILNNKEPEIEENVNNKINLNQLPTNLNPIIENNNILNNKNRRSLSPKLKNKREKSKEKSKEKSYEQLPFYDDGSCWACDVGCSVSTTGYSPMNFSPYNNKFKRQNVTYVSPNVKYKQYTRHKKIIES